MTKSGIHHDGRLLALAVCIPFAAGLPAGWAQGGYDYCPILDEVDEPVWQAQMGYVASARVHRFKDVGIIEAGAGAGLLYFHVPAGEVDVRADIDTLWFAGTGGIRLPSAVMAARVEAQYVLRMRGGYAVRLGAEPGFYTEIAGLDADHFFVPFYIHGLWTLRPDLSGLIGAHVYPGFDRSIDPRIGVRWRISDFLQLDAFYPKTELVVRPNFDWAVRVGVEIRDHLEYQLEGSDDRERLLIDETRLFIGVDKALTMDMQLMLQVGRVVNRSFDFKRFEPEKDVEDALFFRIGIGGLI